MDSAWIFVAGEEESEICQSVKVASVVTCMILSHMGREKQGVRELNMMCLLSLKVLSIHPQTVLHYLYFSVEMLGSAFIVPVQNPTSHAPRLVKNVSRRDFLITPCGLIRSGKSPPLVLGSTSLPTVHRIRTSLLLYRASINPDAFSSRFTVHQEAFSCTWFCSDIF